VKRQLLNIALVILLVFLWQNASYAQDSREEILYSVDGYTFPYDINKPDESWELSKKLEEVSGLGYIDKYRLACVQDEKGNIYVFNTKSGEVEIKIDFAEDGDYEGIEVVGDDAWVMKSNGEIYLVEHFMDDSNRITHIYETPLTKRNDPEGLGYDPLNETLLIPCKGYPFINNKEGKSAKAIYTFDIEAESLVQDPQYIIELDTIKEHKGYNTMTRVGLILLSTMDEAKGDITFQPSGIAVHPVTNDIYILGAVGNLLLIIDHQANVKALVELKSKRFEQPEGICFSPYGDLYIANEGKDKKAVIFRFRIR